MEIRKIIGIAFIAGSLITIGIFITQTEFSIQLQDWISFNYYMQFAPHVISIMLLYCGLYLIRKNPKSNFALAIFGYTIFELVALDWIGIVPNNLGTITTILFGCCAIIALWIAHTNLLNLKRLSWPEVLTSIFIGALESLLLFYLNSIG
ncbi:MAG: hypothetical protein CMP48_26845 [Rickettsiales bacterium]|nr:hypothetical protein [Rickettsiales bacterium]